MSTEAYDKLLKKLRKLDSAYLEKVVGHDNNELEQEILRANRSIVESIQDRDGDVALKSLKEEYKEKSGMYNDEIKLERVKAEYCVHLMKDRGKA